MIPPKMAIQMTQVRGGTLNSPGLREFLSSSLYLFSSDIVTYRWRNISTEGVNPQSAN